VTDGDSSVSPHPDEEESHVTRFYAFLQSFVAAARDSEAGQTMAEYAVVLALITVAIVTTLGYLAGGINDTLSSVTDTL
jgi:Flp pilus assembly pilin Flp